MERKNREALSPQGAPSKEAPLGETHSHGPGVKHSHGPGVKHSHVHDRASVKQVLNRLARIEGHIRGIRSMVEEDRNCPEVLIQIAAVRGALDGVARLILDEHLRSCVVRAASNGDIEAELEQLRKALDRFL